MNSSHPLDCAGGHPAARATSVVRENGWRRLERYALAKGLSTLELLRLHVLDAARGYCYYPAGSFRAGSPLLPLLSHAAQIIR